jgi:cephalosporin-C deacetylase
MPILDMPLEELRVYEGTNPRPADFDDYWKRALEELDSTDPDPELTPASFDAAPFAECFDLYFTGVRGARIHAKYLRPRDSSKAHPAVLQFHERRMV